LYYAELITQIFINHLITAILLKIAQIFTQQYYQSE